MNRDKVDNTVAVMFLAFADHAIIILNHNRPYVDGDEVENIADYVNNDGFNDKLVSIENIELYQMLVKVEIEVVGEIMIRR